jgi:tetratricopeptide (TPR) repeat protein
MGCTAEPYLALTPDVGAFTYRFLFLSFSFGEAAYASQPGLSWQITVVGDPLYRPFGRPAEDLHKDLESRHSPLLAWSYLRLANLSLVNGRPVGEVIRMLEDLRVAKQSSVLQEKLGDLYLKVGKPASSKDSYEQALKLDTTPLQRVRLQADLAALKSKPKN